MLQGDLRRFQGIARCIMGLRESQGLVRVFQRTHVRFRWSREHSRDTLEDSEGFLRAKTNRRIKTNCD